MRVLGKRLGGWLGTRDRELPRKVRFAVFVIGLVALAGSYVATQSEGLQQLVVLALIFFLVPVATRMFAVEARRSTKLLQEELNPPLRVLALLALLFAPWILFILVIGDLGLGDWFWMWALLMPFGEIHQRLAERDLQRTGGKDWPKIRPVHDALIAGLITLPLITLVLLLDGESVTGSLLNGLLCGAIVVGISAAHMRLAKRTANSRRRDEASNPVQS
jgi:hypothetical protein